MRKLKVLDLFSGIGGFSLGLERTGGFETVAFCEIDEHARKVLKKYWSDRTMFEDVTMVSTVHVFTGENYIYEFDETGETVRDQHYDSIDVICGGFPCQDISGLNRNGRGLNGERSGLWKEFFRLVKEIRPKYVIAENVTRLRSKGLARIIKDFWSIGYDCEWHCVPCSAVGLDTERDRLWIIAYPQGERAGLHEPRIWRQLKRKNLQNIVDSNKKASSERIEQITKRFECKPTVNRGDDGLSKKLDKIRRKQLGNSVSPLVVQVIGEAIIDDLSTQLEHFRYFAPCRRGKNSFIKEVL